MRVIVYKTRFGSSREYAELLAKKFNCKAVEADKTDLSKYDSIIAISGTYAGRIPIIELLKKNWEKIKDKSITIIAVGLLPENNWWNKVTYLLIPGNIRKKAKYFRVMGRDPDSKKPVDKNNLNKVIEWLTKRKLGARS